MRTSACGLLRSALVSAVAVVCAAAPACADTFVATIGLTLNPVLGGIHESFNSRIRVPPVPIPLLEVTGRAGPFEIDLEGLPPLASVRSFNQIEGHTSTQLSIFEAIVRVWNKQHRLSAGIGQTLYNQSTHYRDPIEIAGTGETQFSRVTGLNYQAGYRVPLIHGRLEAVFDYAPVMLGTQFTLYDIGRNRGRVDPERAQQIDTAVRYVRALGPNGELVLGVRYINYTAMYAERNGGLSDRNVGLLPVFGYRLRLAR